MIILWHTIFLFVLWLTIGFFAARWAWLVDDKSRADLIEIRGNDIYDFAFEAIFWPITLIVIVFVLLNRRIRRNGVWFTIKRK